MTVRAKLQLATVTIFSATSRKLHFTACYDPSLAEDVSFNKASPNASFEIWVDNPKAYEQFEIGKQYYVDFSPVPTPAA